MSKTILDQICERICTDVCELPDRASPEDQPDMMLVSGPELAAIIEGALTDHGVSEAALAICDERRQHFDREGWTQEHDDEHDDGSLALAAAAYAIHAANPNSQIDLRVGRRGEWFNGGWMGLPRLVWPKSWDWSRWWKPKDPARDLQRAGALIIAELERRSRADAR